MAGDASGEPMVPVVPGSDGRQRARWPAWPSSPESGRLTAGATTTWRFRIVDCDGKALRDFEPEHAKLLHLIVARTDLTGYQHLHPRLRHDGTWSVAIATPRAGALPRDRRLRDRRPQVRRRHDARAFPARPPTRRLPAPSLHARADGYDVELQRPGRAAGGRAGAADLPHHPRRPARRRPPALPRRLRPPRRAARARSRLLARPPQRRGPRKRRHHLRHRGPRTPARTGCSCSSRPTGRVHTAAFTQTVS